MANKGLYYISSRTYILGVGWSEWSRVSYNGEFYTEYTEAEKVIEDIGELDGTELKVQRVGNYPFVDFKG